MFQAGFDVNNVQHVPNPDYNYYYAVFLDQLPVGQNFVYMEPQGDIPNNQYVIGKSTNFNSWKSSQFISKGHILYIRVFCAAVVLNSSCKFTTKILILTFALLLWYITTDCELKDKKSTSIQKNCDVF